jgi:hypothetical protein
MQFYNGSNPKNFITAYICKYTLVIIMNKRTFLKTGLLGFTGMALAKNSQALEYYPTVSDKKCALVYSTWCGTARDAAVWISEGMNGIADVFDVREDPNMMQFENIVAGGAIRGGKVSPLMEEFLKKNREVFKTRLRGYFAVCGNLMQPVTPQRQTQLIDNYIADLCGVKGLPAKVFLGRITFGLMEEDVRKTMQNMEGIKEYDNLKRPECMAFGKEVLDKNRK